MILNDTKFYSLKISILDNYKKRNLTNLTTIKKEF